MCVETSAMLQYSSNNILIIKLFVMMRIMGTIEKNNRSLSENPIIELWANI